MSSLIKLNRNVVAAIAALALILVPLNISSAKAEGGNSDTTLSVFTVDGNPVIDDQTVTLEPGTQSVEVVATPTDPGAVQTITGNTGLITGNNPLVVSVLASDGVTVGTHSVNLYVEPIPLSSDATLTTFTINGNSVVDGEDIYLAHGTTSVTAVVETSSLAATYTITGTEDLVDGDNPVVVTVTAEDGTIVTYTVNLAVALNSDTSLITFQVAGEDVQDGSVVELPALTLEADVLVETTDPDAIYEIIGDTELVAGENTLEIAVTAADGATTESYFVTLNVAFNTDAGANRIMIDGLEVVDGETIDLEPLTVSVEVDVETADPDATFEVTGATDLVAGENTLTIVVTAADSTTTAEYSVILNVLRNDDTSLATFQVNGMDVEDGSLVQLDPLTSSVDVFFETTDENATVEVVGDTDLLVGENQLEVIVTAADGITIQTYEVILQVLPNTDTTADITVNGETVVDGDLMAFEWGVTEVEVEVITTDPDATFSISGETGLVVGENELSIIITAADGETYETITVTLVVQPNTDASLSLFQVNGIDVNDGDVIDAEPNASSVEVVVETTDPEASYEITGDTDLLVGENELVVSVVAADGVTLEDFLVTIVVPLNDDATVSSILVDENEVVDGDTLELEPYTTSVAVLVETTDPEATYEVDGTDELVDGANTLTVTVTAADGETTASYEITLVVLLSEDTSLSTFQINGIDVNDGDTLEVEPGTTDVSVDVEATDSNAIVTITGDTDMMPGENDVVISVIAADGMTTQDYLVTIVVPLNDDATVSSILVDENEVVDGDTLELEPYTTSVAVLVETTDPEATYEVDGTDELVDGANTLTVTVTAADGETTASYEITLVVLLSEDTSLSTFQINGIDVNDGDTLEVEPGTTDVSVDVEATDSNAIVTITGDTDMMPGENDVVISVIAADGMTTQDYLVIVSVPLNNDTSLTSLLVEGTEVVDGDTVDLAPYTTNVDVEVETTDPEAIFEIEGNDELEVGANTLTITVTAADGETTATYEITLLVAVSEDVSLSIFQINDSDVNDGDTIEVEPGTTAISVDVETTDANATFTISGDTGLEPGNNDLVVSVVAADGITTYDYLVIVSVPLNNDTSIEAILVDGTEVAVDDSLDLEAFTSDVEVEVITTDPDATVEIDGSVGLVAGDNTLTITVTAADGETTETFEVILVVAFNNDTSLAFFQVNGTDVADGDSVETEPGAKDVLVDVETTDPDATVEISGDSELVAGDNTLEVTVTAADGETVATYTVGIFVPLNDDASVSSILVNGDQVYDGDALELDPYTTEVEVEVTTTDSDAVFDAQGTTDLVVGDNTLTITVTAADGTTTETFVITLNVAAGNDASLAVFQIDGEDVENGATITVDPLTTSVEVTVETTDPEATFEISGNEELMEGLNEILVAVTAQNGEDYMEYSVLVEVPVNNDATAKITVDGSDVVDGDIVVLPAGTTEVDVNVETTDPEADAVIDGGLSLETGENTLLIIVTAADGETTLESTITLLVLASDDTSLATFQVNEQDVQDGDVLELESLTTEVGVTVETTDPDATYEITGDSELFPGTNTLTVTVTAADGVTVVEHNVTLEVALGNSVELSVFTVAGADVTDGDVIDLVPGTSDVEVDVQTEDPNASVSYVGDSGLEVGENILLVTVVSANEEETAEYTVILNVLVGVDTTLATFQIDGNDVADGDVVDLEPGTTSIDVEVITNDENATFEITGDTNLVVGENILTVIVTAEDGETISEYTITLVLPANNDTGLAVFEVNGSEVNDGDTLDLDSGMTEVFVRVETSDPEATFDIEGGTDLVKGENTLIIHVTAADGETTQDHTVTLYVPSDDASVTSILINGLASVSGDVITVEPDSESVDVEVTTTDENARVEIKGADALVQGENEILVTVIAEDGTTQEFNFTVRVGGQSADTALTSLTVNGTEVVDGSTIQLPSRTTAVNVVAVTRDAAATVKIIGRTGLVVGSNTIQVAVTAPDLRTIRYIYITAVVAPLSSNTNLAEFSVNGIAATDKGTVELAPLTRSVTVVAKPADAEAVVVVAGKTVVDGPNTLTVTVTAANGTVRTYTVTMVVRVLSADTSLKTFTINGTSAAGGTFTTAPGATSVNVVALATESRATVSIIGASALRIGENTVSVLVTAENGSSKTYKIVVTVPASNNAGLKSLAVNGVDVAVASRVTLPRGTKSVLLKAVASDVEAKVSVAGGLNLVAGDNSVVVTITAPDGVTVATYGLTLYVTPPSSDKSLKSFKINGLTVVDAGTVTVPALTTSVNVEASTNDPEASVVVAGRTGLLEGANTVTVTVTAADLSTRTYTVTVRVLSLSSDNSLKSLKVNGLDYTTGTINVAYGVRSITVLPVVNDSSASVSIIGNGALRTGANTVIVRVTAANGAIADTSIPVVVAKSNNTALTSLTMNGIDATAGTTITQPVRTTTAVVKAVTADPEATVAVTGTALVEGNNTVVLTVTAPDGTVRTVNIPVYVTPLSTNTNLSVFKVNNVNVGDLGSVTVANRTVSVPVSVIPADSESIVVISGSSALKTGTNTITVTVTAPSGAKKTYTVTVTVLKSSNTALTALSVNGVDASAGGTVTLPVRTTVASVKAVTADPETAVAVTGTALVEGSNTVVLTVTAPDGTVRTVNIPVYVTPLSTNTNLSVLKVNNVTVVDGGSIEVANRTVSVPVTATPADAESVVAVTGNSALRTGVNTVSILVTAPSGAKKTYTVTVTVLKSSNTALTALSVNGVDASAGGTVTLPVRTTVASVKAVTADPETAVAVTGTALVEGSNTVVLTVTAPDGTVRTVNIPVYVTPLSTNTNLSVLKVNNVTVVDGGSIEVANRTVSVPVTATPADAESVVAVTGNSALRTGVNTVSILVTAPSGAKKTYTVTLVVLKSNNTALNSLTVNGSAVVAGATVTLAPRTVSAVVKAVTTDPEATVAVSGASGLVSGSNTASVTVTAADGSTRRVEFTLYVTPLSSDNTLKSLTVNGSAYVADSTVELPLGTASVAVVAVANDASASVEITGNTALTGGLNTVSVKVTAANGDVRTYTAKVNVPVRSSNANISTVAGTWTINGVDVAGLASDAVAVELPAGTNAITATAKTEDTKATIVISGTTGLVTGPNTITFTVTAENGTTIQTYTRIVSVKALSTNTKLTSLTVAGQSATNGSTINVVAGTTRVEVLPILESSESRFTVSGNTGLNTGTNTVTVVVTAPSGATSTTTVTVVVATPASDTSLSTFTINGVAVTNGSSIAVAAGTTRLHVSAIANDSTASVAVTGRSELQAGSNTLTVTVTAISGDKSTYIVTVNVG